MNKIIIYTQAYNAEKTIRSAIESVAAQTYGNYYHYILDNGSSDRTGEIINEYISRDTRIIKLTNKVNNVRAFWDYLPFIINKHDDDCWFAVIDADDTYHSTFFEKMLGFAIENNLDLVSCGYDTVNAQSGRIIMRRALGYNLIISGSGFADDFIHYRRYMCSVWCKLYSFSLLKKGVVDAAKPYSYLIQCADTAFTTKAFQSASKAGILGESLHRYSISDNSISFTFIPSRVESDQALFNFTKEYLNKFGEISKINHDYLYAIYLGLISETLKVIYNSGLELQEKLKYISDIFNCQISKDMLKREADPLFINLGDRETFLVNVINWIKEQKDWQQHRQIVDKIILDMGIVL